MADLSYLDLAGDLARDLQRVDVGTRVISEHELARSSGVSRPTARAALQELERRYLVRRVRGAGTFVHRRMDYVIGPDTPPSWSENVRKAGSVPYAQIDRIRTGVAPREVRDRLELTGDARVVTIMRTTHVDGLPAGVGNSQLPEDLVPDLAPRLRAASAASPRAGAPRRAAGEAGGGGVRREAGVAAGPAGVSIYRTLVDHYGIEPVRTWTTASLEIPPSDVADQMGLEAPEPTWYTESINRDRSTGRPVELSRGWMRADVYRIILQAGTSGPAGPIGPDRTASEPGDAA